MSQPRKIFPSEPIPQPARQHAVRDTRALLGQKVPVEAVRRFLDLVILPPSESWAFLSTGKAASSSVLRFLYEIEYGHPLTSKFISPHDINPAAVVHQLSLHGVFGRARMLGLSIDAVKARTRERLLVVRNPHARAASAFRYLCRSHELGAGWFLTARLRLEARTGFDWTSAPGTLDGFLKFLDFLEAEAEDYGPDRLDTHWCSQARFARPEIYEPTLVGRVEAMDDFFSSVCERLDTPMPATIRHENCQSGATADDPLAAAPEARQRIERIYAADFEAFGY